MKHGLPSHKQRGKIYFVYSEVLEHIKHNSPAKYFETETPYVKKGFEKSAEKQAFLFEKISYLKLKKSILFLRVLLNNFISFAGKEEKVTNMTLINY